jgi:hypothetical protein
VISAIADMAAAGFVGDALARMNIPLEDLDYGSEPVTRAM